MPRLPSVDSGSMGERPIPSNRTMATSYRGESGAETVPGESIMKLGQTLGQSADQLHQAIKIEEERTDKIVVEDAFNRLREKQLDLTVGEKDGFIQQKGKSVLDGKLYNDYTQRFNDAANEIGAELTSDRQRELYRQRAGMAGLQYRENIMQHVVRERDAMAKEVTKNGIDLEVKNVALRWQDPNTIGMSLVRAKGLLDAEADRESWTEQKREEVFSEIKSKVNTSVIMNALAANNYGYASQWYKQNKGDIVGDEAIRVQSALKDSGVKAESQAAMDKIVAKFNDKGAALDAAKQIKDPNIRDATETRVRQYFADVADVDNRRRNEAFVGAANAVEKAGSIDSIDPASWSLFGPSQRAALTTLAESVRKGESPKQDDTAWVQFLGMGPLARAQLTEAQLLEEYKPRLDREHWNQVARMWQTSRDALQGKPGAQEKIKDELSFEQRFTNAYQASGLLPSGKTVGNLKDDQAAQYAKLRTQAADEVLAYKRAHGKDYIPPEEQSKIINRILTQKVFVDKPWWADEEKPMAMLTEDERGKAYIPAKSIPSASVLAIKQQAGRLKVNVSERQIERAYAAAKMGASDAYINAILTGKQ